VRRGRLLAATAAGLLVILALVLALPDRMLSPGTLMRSHAALSDNCFACHSPWRGATADRCTGCHRLRDIGLRTTRGLPLAPRNLRASFHPELIERDCMACHRDHAGTDPATVSSTPFSHALLRPAVRERCEQCHAAPSDHTHAELAGGCGRCHAPERWRPAAFDRNDHQRLFVLDAEHGAPCATCHLGNELHRYTCYGCHEHRPDPIRARHLEEGIRNFDDCVRCHRSASAEPEGDD
jgi:Class III cytochrome C family